MEDGSPGRRSRILREEELMAEGASCSGIQSSESVAGFLVECSPTPFLVDGECSSSTCRNPAAGRSSAEIQHRRSSGVENTRKGSSSLSVSEENGVRHPKRTTRGHRNEGFPLRRHRVLVPGGGRSQTYLGVSTFRKGSGEERPEFEPRSRENSKEIELLGLPLGMSMAVVFSKVLYGANATGGNISAEHLSRLCSSAIKESLVHAFGSHFNSFIQNFESSFGSTLKTLHLVNEASLHQQRMVCSTSALKDCMPDALPTILSDKSSVLADEVCQITSNNVKLPSHVPGIQEHPDVFASATSFVAKLIQDTHSVAQESPTVIDKNEDSADNFINGQVVIHGQVNQQLSCISEDMSDSRFRGSILGTFERSVREQERSNDLKTFEIGLTMKNLQLKESKLMIDSDANLLERLKLSFGFSKASFKKDRLENQMKEEAYSEFKKSCADCLLGGILIMSASVGYATYVYSYDIFVEASSQCNQKIQNYKGWRNWWMPKTVSSMSTPLIQSSCYIVILGRMLFSLSFFAFIAHLLLRQSSCSGQTTPITFILIILGVAGSASGKLCVDGLGGSGNCWMFYWCILCSLHAIANMFTPALHYVINGPVTISQRTEKISFPYWIRRSAFYSCIFIILPVLCGLMPFATLYDWGQHILSREISG